LNSKNEKEVFVLNPPDTRSATELASELRPYFGTPRRPLVDAEDAAAVADLLLDGDTLKEGSKLYRKYCLHCHGLVGDGNGSTAGPADAPFLVPRPRDFRHGLFKFRSTAQIGSEGKPNTAMTTLPSREDLAKTIRQGVPTANMPSFNLLLPKEIDELVSYVIHLTLRGQTEFGLARNPDAEAAEEVSKHLTRWRSQSKLSYRPPPPNQGWSELRRDRERGRKVYLSQDAGCLSCHGQDGRSSKIELPTNVGRRNDWGDLNAPRDLTLGAYRGGSRPVDIFYRIKLGIAGSGMPPASDKVSDEDLWYLVDYVLSLPQQK
jgi:mono/diheme cytochrome c family protein